MKHPVKSPDCCRYFKPSCFQVFIWFIKHCQSTVIVQLHELLKTHPRSTKCWKYFCLHFCQGLDKKSDTNLVFDQSCHLSWRIFPTFNYSFKSWHLVFAGFNMMLTEKPPRLGCQKKFWNYASWPNDTRIKMKETTWTLAP